MNFRKLVEYWTCCTSGEYVWGKGNIDSYLKVEEIDGKTRTMPFMVVLNQKFNRTSLLFESLLESRLLPPSQPALDYGS